jgi:mRNA interferase RelE/StbE
VTWRPHRVAYKAQADRDLARLGRALADRIMAAIDRYAETGHGDVKELQGRTDQWRLRVGDWRVIFTLDHGNLLVIVLRVVPRGNAYR